MDLFGSVACGVASTDSDVDLLVGFERPDQKLREVFRPAYYFKDTLGFTINLLTTNSKKHISIVQVLEEKVTVYER